jgi:glycine cleavage system H protein
MAMTPENLRYSEEHEWVRLEGQTAVVGITDYAQKKLGDIVFVELPEVGKALKAGGTLGAIESVKAASEIYCPVAGAVSEVNDDLADSPGSVNKDPYGDGWIAKLSGVSQAEFDKLMDAASYEELTAGEEEK